MDIINSDLDTTALHDEYTRTGSVVIRNLLSEEVAAAVYDSLEKNVPWELHIKRPNSNSQVEIISHAETLKLSDKERLKLVPKALKLKNQDLSFIYNRYTIPILEQEVDEGTRILTEVFRYFNSEAYLRLMGDVTGDYSGREVSLWASRYDPHHHLSVHHDINPTQGRIAAHVLGLTRNWKKEWGGQFAYCNDRGKPVSLHVPQFNQLTLFKVPRAHLVNQVKPYAQGYRYSLFGWYKSKQEYFR